MKKIIWFFIPLILICFVVKESKIFLKTENAVVLPTPTTSSNLTIFTTAKVIKVIDGDTIEIEGGQRVRYIGIDTTEVYPNTECYSGEAKAENEKLVGGKIIKLEKDVSDTDKYGRLLRYVYVDEMFVNEELLKAGYAKTEIVPPDIKFKNRFLNLAKYAKENNLGFWSSCKSV